MNTIHIKKFFFFQDFKLNQFARFYDKLQELVSYQLSSAKLSAPNLPPFQKGFHLTSTFFCSDSGS